LKYNLLFVIIAVTFPAIIVIVISPLIKILYGSSYIGLEITLSILALSTIFASISGVMGSIITSLDKMWVGFFVNLIWGMVFLLVINWVSNLNSITLACAYLISYVILFIVASGSVLGLSNTTLRKSTK
jgi:O-antigen/teichoic acid export membrane protein